MEKKTLVRIVCAILVGIMVLGLIPAAVFAAAGDTLYLQPSSNWCNDSARFAAYFFGTDGEAWNNMTDSDGDGVFECTIPGNFESVIFCRMNPDSTENNWNDGVKWNQTADLTIPTDGKNCFTCTEGTWDNDSGSWSTIEVDDNGCDHSYDAGSVTTAATCTTAGVKTYTCTLCGATKTEAISATGHSYADGVCSVCGVAETEDRVIYFVNSDNWSAVYAYSWTDSTKQLGEWPGTAMTLVEGETTLYSITVPADTANIIFNDGNGTQTSDLTLSSEYNCYNYTNGWDLIVTCDHAYIEEITTAATCETAGVKTFTCGECGDSYTEAIAALGHSYVDGVCETCGKKEPCTEHSWDEGTVTTVATCTTDGVKTFACANCDETKTETIAALGHSYVDGVCSVCGMVETCDVHSWDEGVVIEEKTCWMPGTKLVTCTKCGATEEQIIYPGHDLYDGEITVQPTCTTSGSMKRPCYNCSAVYSKTIPALGHDYVAGETVAPTCTVDGYTVYGCSRCDKTENRDIVYHTGHNWNGNTCTVCGTTCNHTLVDGICSACGYGGPAFVNGYYEIANAAQLKWFADQVNGGDNAINGKLIADIDLENTTWTAIGYYCTGGDADDSLYYKGIFDGNGYTVSNFTVAGDDSVGLFGYTEIGTIKNLGVINATATGANAGAIVGYNATATVINCYAINCTITGYTTNAIALNSRRVYVGAVAGQGSGYVYNCYAVNCTIIDKTGDMTVPEGETYTPWHEFLSAPVGGNGSSISNNYYYNVSGTFYSTAGATEVSAAQMSSGEVAYKLQGSQAEAVWGQAIGSDAYPVIFGKTVYLENGAYINKADCNHSYSSVVTAPTCTTAGYTTYTCTVCGDSYTGNVVAALGHSWTDATCTAPKTCSICGATEGEALGHEAYTYAYADGVHTLTCTKCGEATTMTASDSKQFKINSAAPVLSDDIVLKYRVTVPAGFENAYMVFELNGEKLVVTDYTVESDGKLCFAFPGLNPQKMGDAINAYL
ncbi:MAG: starch-binding protein, partial [Oscillospiraceae bacterium]|nr:starch-binding protein [Oscillospiraceae bacterium]